MRSVIGSESSAMLLRSLRLDLVGCLGAGLAGVSLLTVGNGFGSSFLSALVAGFEVGLVVGSFATAARVVLDSNSESAGRALAVFEATGFTTDGFLLSPFSGRDGF